eukprot:CAMPEP_0174256008 /NCGR_PEP_ID=MMETSP0439-20130205/5279_1 /TAXON_ID=0 /ORGANISM="Stereomyxa ramosa, Strain Chinc5" /LENGTH=722 /DNA_ID=CAMNT_0015338431 /DNA_START=28 /DNA_END=2196 /DNA_ORIENTATION=-
MGRKKKSTKKFQHRQLSQVVKQRKEFQHKKENRRKPKRVQEEVEQSDPTFKEPDASSLSIDAFMSSDFFRVDDHGKGEEEGQVEEWTSESESESEPTAEQHQKDLEKLKETDPEFYAYLQQNGSHLLHFHSLSESESESEGMEGVEEEEDSEGESEEGKDSERVTLNSSSFDLNSPPSSSPVLDLKQVTSWISAATSGSMKATRKLLVAFRVGAHKSDSSTEKGVVYPFVITSSQVFHRVMLFCIRNIHTIFDTQLSYQRNDINNDKPVLPSSCERWKRVEKMAFSYIYNLLYFVQQPISPQMKLFVLKQAQHLVPYAAALPNISKRFLRVMSHVWSHDDETSRILAFLNIHLLASITPYPFINYCLKTTYLTFVRNSKFTNVSNYGLVNFMSNCVVELYLLDPVSSYQHAFVYIRQLAIHLRNALSLKSKESYQNVYNWQFINSLKVWASLLSSGGGSMCSELVYPLVQIIFGVISLIPTPKYFPLHFQCIRILISLAQKNKIFINTIPYILQVFESQLFKKSRKPSSIKPINFEYNLKVGPKVLSTVVYQRGVFGQVIELLTSAFHLYSDSIAFPEFTVPALARMKKFCKETKDPTFKKEMMVLIAKVQETVLFVDKERSKLSISAKEMMQDAELNRIDKVTPYQTWIQKKQNAKNKTIPKKNLPYGPVLPNSKKRKISQTPPTDPETTKKEKKRKKRKKERKEEEMGTEDVVEDLELSD